MNFRKSIAQLAYRPIEISRGVFVSDDKVNYSSKETIIQEYNEKNQLVLEVSGGKLYQYNYDKNFLIEKIEKWASGGDVTKRWVYEYLSHKKPMSETMLCYGENNHVFKETTSYSYKENIEYTYHDGFESYNKIKKFKKNKIVTEKWNWRDRTNSSFFTIEIFRDNVLVEKIEKDRMMTVKWKYSYNDKGNLIETLHINNLNRKLYKIYHKYDEYGNLISEESIGLANNNLFQQEYYSYEYDSNGHWTRKSIHNGKHYTEFVDRLNPQEAFEYINKYKKERV
jgi:hypothetical protein